MRGIRIKLFALKATVVATKEAKIAGQ